MRVSSEMDGILRACDTELSLCANYLKGCGDLFNTWMKENHPGALLLHVERATGSCQDLVVQKEDRTLENNKLIAQADVTSKEENLSNINELVSYDIAFSDLNKIVQSSEYATKFNGTTSYTVFAPLNGAFKNV